MAPLIMTLVGGGVTIAFLVMFRIEKNRGTRFFSSARGAFDESLHGVMGRMSHRFPHLSGQTVRQTVHYMFHKALTAVLQLLARAEDVVRKVVHVNKRSANRANGKQTPNAHFSAIAEHKRSAQLTDAEKQKRREDALNGR